MLPNQRANIALGIILGAQICIGVYSYQERPAAWNFTEHLVKLLPKPCNFRGRPVCVRSMGGASCERQSFIIAGYHNESRRCSYHTARVQGQRWGDYRRKEPDLTTVLTLNPTGSSREPATGAPTTRWSTGLLEASDANTGIQELSVQVLATSPVSRGLNTLHLASLID